jgi:Na+/melibiose symporter-like transporter
MAEQHYKNHSRILPVWHFVGGSLLLAFLVGSIIYFCGADRHTHFLAALLLIASVLFVLLFIYARAFALRAQDRAIRAEENFRHYLLTGKPLDPRLRLGQIIALRFAPDEEFPALTQRAVNEKLSQKQIKQAIRNWRADYYRV